MSVVLPDLHSAFAIPIIQWNAFNGTWNFVKKGFEIDELGGRECATCTGNRKFLVGAAPTTLLPACLHFDIHEGVRE